MPSAEPHADCLCPHNLDRLSHVVTTTYAQCVKASMLCTCRLQCCRNLSFPQLLSSSDAPYCLPKPDVGLPSTTIFILVVEQGTHGLRYKLAYGNKGQNGNTRQREAVP